jgi:hypothetical protein
LDKGYKNKARKDKPKAFFDTSTKALIIEIFKLTISSLNLVLLGFDLLDEIYDKPTEPMVSTIFRPRPTAINCNKVACIKSTLSQRDYLRNPGIKLLKK